MKYIYILLLLVIGSAFISSCNDNWDDHYTGTNGSLSNNVMELISADPRLDKFGEFLVKTGYDQILQGSLSFTVWAPTNEALASLDAFIQNDSALLRKFVENHICYSQVYTNEFSTEKRIKNLAGKSIYFTKTGDSVFFDQAKIIEGNLYTRNGALYVIDKFIPVTKNLWEYLNDPVLGADYTRISKYISSLDNWEFDEKNAIKLGVNNDGKNIYDSVRATHFRFIYKNSYFDNVTNINSEDYDYTFFALTNNAMDLAFSNLVSYYRASTNVTYDKVDTVNVYSALLYNMAAKGKLAYDSIANDTILSENGNKLSSPKPYMEVVPVKLSNGYLYQTNQFAPSTAEMLKSKVIEAENSTGRSFFYDGSKSGTITGSKNVRQLRSYASGGYDFFYNPNNPVSKDFGVIFDVPNVQSVEYKFFWVTSPEPGAYQILEVYDVVSKTWKTIGTERLSHNISTLDSLGNFKFPTYGTHKVRVRVTKGANVTLIPTYGNILRLDYIKMVPVLQ